MVLVSYPQYCQKSCESIYRFNMPVKLILPFVWQFWHLRHQINPFKAPMQVFSKNAEIF